MANAQIKFWNNNPKQKSDLVSEILRVTRLNRGQLHTSHELTNLMNPAVIALVNNSLVGYQNSGYAEPASHIGSLCAELAQQGLLVHGKKYCSFLHRIDDAFAV